MKLQTEEEVFTTSGCSQFVSPATGLVVARVRHASPGHAISVQERGQLARLLPGVVLLNTVSEEALLLGLDCTPDQVTAAVAKLSKEASHWVVTLEDVSGPGQDPFSFFRGWTIIPRVDKNGMYSLIVNLRMKGKTKMTEVEDRRRLLSVIQGFNITRTIHGEGETMIQVSHVLEFIAYSDCIRRGFAIERRHTWQLKPTGAGTLDPGAEEGVRYCWVTVNCPELRQLTPAHKQFTVHQHLARLGSVVQLEHNIFGVPDNYLASFSGQEKLTITDVDPQLSLVELAPASLPDSMIPTYGVDDHGFYTVSGTFPRNSSSDLRDKFSADMKQAGAVGFRSGASDEEFSLHFVNSRCLEQINKSGQYANFNLKIHSSLIRKSSLEKKIKKLVPAILKIKEVQSKCVDEMKTSNLKKNDVKGDSKADEKIQHKDELEGSKLHPRLQKEVPMAANKVKEVDTVSKLLKMDKNHNENQSATATERCKDKAEIPGPDDKSIMIYEKDLLKINWIHGKSLSQASKGIGRLFDGLGNVDVSVDEPSQEIKLHIRDQQKFDKYLKQNGRMDSNSVEKLRSIPKPRFVLQESSSNRMFGLTLPKKKKTLSELEDTLGGKFPGKKFEERADVLMVWFKTKLQFFKALADPAVNFGFTPAVANFVDFRKTETKKPENESANKVVVKVDKNSKKKVESTATATKIENEDKNVFTLTENQVFGFVWRKPSVQSRIRDDQVISRQFTEFIKSVDCQSIDQDDNGFLIFKFSSKESLQKAVAQYCPEAARGPEFLDTMSRKFTLIPWRGSFGIFSSKRLKMEDIKKIGKCKLNMCSLWFADKLDVIRVLRDPALNKMYPGLYIDCRNIYILRSIRNPGAPGPLALRPPVHYGPRPAPIQNPRYLSLRPPYPMIGFHNNRLPRPRFSIHNPAILRSASFTFRSPHSYNSYRQSTSVITHIMPRAFHNTFHRPRPRFHSRSFDINFSNLMIGKFGVVPSNRILKNGYKLYKIPQKDPRNVDDIKLFLENKDQFRSKDVEAAADEVKSILNGKEDQLGSLKELKMRRVELFLREQLGVEELERKVRSCGQNIFLNLIENGKKNVLEEVEDKEVEKLTPDLLGLYTITVPCTPEVNVDPDVAKSFQRLKDSPITTVRQDNPSHSFVSNLEDDVSWFQPPISILPVTDPVSGQSVLEVKMKSEEVTIAAFHGLKHKYNGMSIDKTGVNADILPDKETGMFTLVFTDKKEKKYAGTAARFQQYCTQPRIGPVISRGEAPLEVRLAFKIKEEAILALKDNVDNDEFPELRVAPCSRRHIY